MAPQKYSVWSGMLLLILLCVESDAKFTEGDISGAGHLEKPVKERDIPELKAPKKVISNDLGSQENPDPVTGPKVQVSEKNVPSTSFHEVPVISNVKQEPVFVFTAGESSSQQNINECDNNQEHQFHVNISQMSDGASLLFADELKVTLERYLFGICPQTFKMQLGRTKNTSVTCDLDVEQQDLAGRFATLALRAHSAARSDCARLGAALVNTLGDLARTAAGRHAVNVAAATAEANKKRKLSKSQKAKIQAKQRTALAVKKKAAAVAAAAAAKMTGTAS